MNTVAARTTFFARTIKSTFLRSTLFCAMMRRLIFKSFGQSVWLRKGAALTLTAALLLQALTPAIAYANYQPTPLQKFEQQLFAAPAAVPTVQTASSTSWLQKLIRKLDATATVAGETGDNLAGENAASNEETEEEKKARAAVAELSDKAALANNVKRIETFTENSITLSTGGAMRLAALPLDEREAPVNGMIPVWTSADESTLEIKEGNIAVARRAGETILRVRAGAIEKEINVQIIAAKTNDAAPTGKSAAKTTFSRSKEIAAENTSGDSAVKSLLPSPSFVAASSAPRALIIRPNLSEGERASTLSSENNLGQPFGQTELSAPLMSAAGRTRERKGIENFSFDIPVASLPGRGVDASIGITYNSRVWNKYRENNVNRFTYNVDGNWLAPGFQIGFGYLDEYMGSVGVPYYFVTSPDGTRGALYRTRTVGNDKYWESKDGSFLQIKFSNGDEYSYPAAIKVRQPDGSTVVYGPNIQGRRLPSSIIDPNGNTITISYLGGDGDGKIAYILDTLGRYITFHYDTTPERKLVAVTVPDFGGSTTTARQTIRFYYEDVQLSVAGRFNGTVTAPASIKALRYVYFPATASGYKYDYSPHYGLVYKIWELRGMQISENVNSSTSLTQTGTVTNEGTWAASTEYNYPTAARSLDEVPKYTNRYDDWQGRTTADVAVTNFQVDEVRNSSGVGTRTTTITSPDQTKTLTVSHVGDLILEGLIKETSVTSVVGGQTKVWAKSAYTWEEGDPVPYSPRRNPRINREEITNDAGQTRAITYSYDGYNNPTAVREHDFAAPGQNGTELRKIETSYETTANYVNNNILRLPRERTVVVNSAVVSRVKYYYDGTPLVSRNRGILGSTHSTAYDPNEGGTCSPVCIPCRYDPGEYCPTAQTSCNGITCPAGKVCGEQCQPGQYDQNNQYRGNVTKIVAFADAAANNENAAENSVTTFKYDITGNAVEAALNCCRVKKWEYSEASKFAYQTKETRGESPLLLITKTAYDVSTGLVTETEDENGQKTLYEYYAANLRLKRIDSPNGGYTTYDYDDGVISSVKTKTKIDAFKESETWQFVDGRGQAFRTRARTPEGAFLSSDAEFDVMGRTVKSYNPYTVAAVNSARPGNVPATEVEVYDALGRATRTKLQDGVIVSSAPNTAAVTYQDADSQTRKGTLSHATDGAGKSRWMVVDALGRMIRADEPDINGNLGADGNNPVQPTHYYYDGNDNLSRVVQEKSGIKQERTFVYDALSRLVRERQPEMNPTLSDTGVYGTASPSNWSGVYKYNSYGLLAEGTDARGVKTTLTYDTLNRVKTISYTALNGYQTPQVTYHYDEARNDAGGNPYFNKGRLTKVETAAVSTANQETPATVQIFDYNNLGQIAKQVQHIGGYSYQLKYTYNLAGQLVAEEYPTGKAIRTAVDVMGRTARVFDAKQNYVSGFQYNGNGTLASHFIGNGLQETFTVDTNRLQLNGQSLLKGSEVVQRYDYYYAPFTNIATGQVDTSKNNGQLAKITSYTGGTVSNPTKQWEQRFAYDSVGRISETREYRGDVSSTLSYKQNFDYDRWGNLYRKSLNNQPTGQQTPLAFTPIEESTNAAGDNGAIDKKTNRFTGTTTTGMQYDEAGNTLKDFKFRSLEYFYDANNRMVKTRPVNTTNDSHSVYDAMGQRVATKINNEWRIMVYDAGGKMVCEYTSSQPTEEKSVQYVYSDRQGSTRVITNASGTPISRNDYTAFGEEINAGVGTRTTGQGYAGAVPTRNKYALTERDEATGLDHTWFRKHEQKAGRWTSVDPYKGSMNLGDPQSFNRFTYTNNDPVNYVDPSGLLAMDGYNDPVLMARSRVGGLLWAIQHGGIIGYTYRSGNETYSLTWMIWLVGGNANIKRCGVNPVTGRKGIVPDNSGKEGEIRPGKGGGGFHKDPRDNKVGYHTGIDISAAPGTPIFAFAPGKVQSVTGSILDRKGYGLTITIDHGNGYTSHYAHLSKEYVDKNEQIGSVKKGFFQNQQIGNAGTSGNADEKLLKEAHLHFEIRKNGKDLDPIKFLNNPCPPDFPT